MRNMLLVVLAILSIGIVPNAVADKGDEYKKDMEAYRRNGNLIGPSQPNHPQKNSNGIILKRNNPPPQTAQGMQQAPPPPLADACANVPAKFLKMCQTMQNSTNTLGATVK